VSPGVLIILRLFLLIINKNLYYLIGAGQSPSKGQGFPSQCTPAPQKSGVRNSVRDLISITLSGRIDGITDNQAANDAAAYVTMKLTRKPAPVSVITPSSTSGIMMGQARHSNLPSALPVPMRKHSQAKLSNPAARKI
jgi:hypothetical protein